MSRVVTVSQAASFLVVSERQVRNYAHTGKLGPLTYRPADSARTDHKMLLLDVTALERLAGRSYDGPLADTPPQATYSRDQVQTMLVNAVYQHHERWLQWVDDLALQAQFPKGPPLFPTLGAEHADAS